MKKLLLIFSFSAIAVGAFAQNYGDDGNTITFGLLGGANVSFLQVKSSADVLTYPEAPGSIGLTADFKFNDYFSIRPGLLYAGKGGRIDATYSTKYSIGSITSYETDEYKLHYLEIPLDLVGHIPVGDGANIFLGTGPYFAWALSGTNDQTFNSNSPIKYNIKYGKNGDFKQSDFGATTLLGFQGAKGWAVSLDMNFGLTNILSTNKPSFNATEFKTFAIYVGLGKSF